MCRAKRAMAPIPKPRTKANTNENSGLARISQHKNAAEFKFGGVLRYRWRQRSGPLSIREAASGETAFKAFTAISSRRIEGLVLEIGRELLLKPVHDLCGRAAVLSGLGEGRRRKIEGDFHQVLA